MGDYVKASLNTSITDTATERYTNECTNIGQTCSGTTNILPNLDAI